MADTTAKELSIEIEPLRPPLQLINAQNQENVADESGKQKNSSKIIPAKRHLEQTEEKEVTDNNNPKRVRWSEGGRDYVYETILDSRPSERRENDTEYLIKWQGWPMYDASWHHSDNFGNPDEAIKSFTELSKKEKKKRKKAFKESWRRRMRAKVTDQSTQTNSKEEAEEADKADEAVSSDSDIQFLITTCPDEQVHWPRLVCCLDNFNESSQYALNKNDEAVKMFIGLLTNIILYVNEHQSCTAEIKKIKKKLTDVFVYLRQKGQERSQLCDALPDEESSASDDEDLVSEERSVDEIAGTQSQGEITDKEDLDEDDDYDPTMDE